ncbi:MAG: hypothetical protein KGL32_09910, partial [candidate division NC10 bacterium]|nr:hypothetical protein [candidate division NC10 bacterium]
MPSKKRSNQRVTPEASWFRPRRAGTTRQRAVWALVVALSVTIPAGEGHTAGPGVPCPPTPGVLPANDVARGECLFHSQ